MFTKCQWCGAPNVGKNRYCRECAPACQRDNNRRKTMLHEGEKPRPEIFTLCLAFQGHACAVCKQTEPRSGWQADHDHDTGEFRCILCPGCNNGTRIKDCVEWLQRRIEILQNPPAQSQEFKDYLYARGKSYVV